MDGFGASDTESTGDNGSAQTSMEVARVSQSSSNEKSPSCLSDLRISSGENASDSDPENDMDLDGGLVEQHPQDEASSECAASDAGGDRGASTEASTASAWEDGDILSAVWMSSGSSDMMVSRILKVSQVVGALTASSKLLALVLVVQTLFVSEKDEVVEAVRR